MQVSFFTGFNFAAEILRMTPYRVCDVFYAIGGSRIHISVNNSKSRYLLAAAFCVCFL
jgi:hypothetical protein